ncbi:uncharacterized protein LOC124306804 isoform X1 [Neodiprion virginianus]|uniref:uncharacterized protein LOC124306804 isoform X1 n=1 Tax=Neodiprion virginianus TaxID=2961670 RepID=UPI001EE6BFEB|nr:uncharacterized protein LOC124306804 isoform X1 [Neodiprion virginianus]
MRSEVSEWLATCVGSPICVLLISWTLLIYQNQPSSGKRRIDLLVVAVLAQSLIHQLALLFYAILKLIRPVNHFGELCSTLVWMLNSSSILQELSLTTIAIFAAISCEEVTKNHLKYHLLSMSILSACIGVTGVLNFQPDTCVFVAHELSPKYGIFFNSLRGLLMLTSILSLFVTFYKDICAKPKNELLKSVSDLSDLSSKNSSGFECPQDRTWDPSSVSCTSSSTNSRACLRKKKVVDENNSHSTVYSVLFVCYICNHIPVLVISIRPELLRGFCTPQNIATWLPLLQDVLLPICLAIFDKMFCHYVAKVYTKQDHAGKLSHGGIDGKFRHFEQDAEYKLQLNLNHGLKFPLTNGSLYGRLHNHQNRGRNGTITMGIQHYPRSQSHDENAYSSLPAELTSFTSSTFEPRKDSRIGSQKGKVSSDQQQQQKPDRIRINENFEFGSKRKISSTDVFGQNMENLVQLDDGVTAIARPGSGPGNAPRNHYIKGSLGQICEEGPRLHVPKVTVGLENCSRLEKSLDAKFKYNSCTEIHEIPNRGRKPMRRNQSFDESSGNAVCGLEGDSRTYVKGKGCYPSVFELHYGSVEASGGYDTSDDESCDLDDEFRDFGDTISSCRSCCSVTTVANDDFEFYQRQEPARVDIGGSKRTGNSDACSSMRSFTPKIIDKKSSKSSKTNAPAFADNSPGSRNARNLSKPTIHSYHLKNKITAGYSMNDLDKLTVSNKDLALSVESLRNVLKDSGISYLDNGELCRHDIGGSAPDFKRIFVSEFI